MFEITDEMKFLLFSGLKSADDFRTVPLFFHYSGTYKSGVLFFIYFLFV